MTSIDVLAAAQRLQQQDQPYALVTVLRVLALVAKEQACEHPDKACHGESCPLAKGFYDRLPAARKAAVASPRQRLTQDGVRAVAEAHRICPYYLSQEMARWADVIVADYNYYFDQSALLHSLTVVNEWPVAVLVDEGHEIGRHRTACLMRENQLIARQKRRLKRTTYSEHAWPVAPNLVAQDFAADGPDRK